MDDAYACLLELAKAEVFRWDVEICSIAEELEVAAIFATEEDSIFDELAIAILLEAVKKRCVWIFPPKVTIYIDGAAVYTKSNPKRHLWKTLELDF